MQIDVLGTAYTLRCVNAGEDTYMDKNGFAGYCDAITKEIVILNIRSLEEYKEITDKGLKTQQDETIRHELIHAFLNESGLRESSLVFDSAWSKNEEMVDWLALQVPKLFAAFKAAGAM